MTANPLPTPPPTLQRFNARDDIATLTAALLQDGAVIVEGMLDADALTRINAEIDPYVEAAEPGAAQINEFLDAFFGPRTRHVGSLTAKSPTFVDSVLLHPVMKAICDEVLLPSCARYQLNIASILDRGPGAEPQMLHRDEDVWIHVPKPHPTLQIASVWALVDMHKDNGATAVIPGSHRETRRFRNVEDSEIAYATMPAGSAVIYLGSTLHGGGGNVTQNEWRRAFHMSFCLGWLRTEENNYLGTPPAIAKHLSRPAQELIGYAVHDAIRDYGGYLGSLESRDPVDMLQEGLLG